MHFLATRSAPLSFRAKASRRCAFQALCLAGLTAVVACTGNSATSEKPSKERSAVPVEVAPIQRGTIRLLRVFSGTLEPAAEVQIAPRVTGPVKRIAVDLGDIVEQGQVIAWIDDAELQQAALQAEADLAVANATLAESKATSDYASRALERRESLGAQGVTSQSELDSVRATALAGEANVAVAAARVSRAQAALESARLRLGQAQVLAEWEESSTQAPNHPGLLHTGRAVSARYVDEGNIVSAGTPLLSIVALQPIVAVVSVPERDFAKVAVGMAAKLATDAYPGEFFTGYVTRVAPVFSRATRQVRIEIEAQNSDLRLKPGMFVRADLELERATDATIVPFVALTERGGKSGLFVLDSEGKTVRWAPVSLGIREGPAIQVLGQDLTGRVVTLGQELCDDGSPITVVQSEPAQ